MATPPMRAALQTQFGSTKTVPAGLPHRRRNEGRSGYWQLSNPARNDRVSLYGSFDSDSLYIWESINSKNGAILCNIKIMEDNNSFYEIGGENMGTIEAVLIVAIGFAIGYAAAYRRYKK